MIPVATILRIIYAVGCFVLLVMALSMGDFADAIIVLIPFSVSAFPGSWVLRKRVVFWVALAISLLPLTWAVYILVVSVRDLLGLLPHWVEGVECVTYFPLQFSLPATLFAACLPTSLILTRVQAKKIRNSVL